MIFLRINIPLIAVQYYCHVMQTETRDNDTALLLGEFWSRETDVLIILDIILIKNEILLNLNNSRSKPEFYRLLWDIVVFRLGAYLLNIKELCNIKSRHWDLYAKPDASIGFHKKPKNVVFSIIYKDFRTF